MAEQADPEVNAEDLGYQPRKRLDKVEKHDEVLDRHDTRISRNEQWRLQLMGALKFAGVIVGSGVAMYLVQAVV